MIIFIQQSAIEKNEKECVLVLVDLVLNRHLALLLKQLFLARLVFVRFVQKLLQRRHFA